MNYTASRQVGEKILAPCIQNKMLQWSTSTLHFFFKFRTKISTQISNGWATVRQWRVVTTLWLFFGYLTSPTHHRLDICMNCHLRLAPLTPKQNIFFGIEMELKIQSDNHAVNVHIFVCNKYVHLKKTRNNEIDCHIPDQTIFIYYDKYELSLRCLTYTFPLRYYWINSAEKAKAF